MSIKRYDIKTTPYHEGASMEREPDGDWVRYTDHAEVERRCARLTAAFAQFRFLLDMPPESDENMLVVLARLKNQVPRWQPIATAPKGVPLLVWSPQWKGVEIARGHWDKQDGFWSHWMPLPEPPT